MQYSPKEWVETIIEPSLKYLDCYSVKLALFLGALATSPKASTADTPLYGCYQISREQHWAVWDQFIYRDPAMASKVRGCASQHRFLDNPELELTLNPGYATIIATMMLQQQLPEIPLNSVNFNTFLDNWQGFQPKSDTQRQYTFLCQLCDRQVA